MIDLRGKKIIICGRVSDLLREETEEWFAAAAELCKVAGAESVFNSAKVMYGAKSHETAVRACLGWMVNHANMVVMLPGWAGSIDAEFEYDFAHACGIEVVRITDLMADAKTEETARKVVNELNTSDEISEKHEQRIYDRCIVRVGQLEGENFELRELIADMHALLQRVCDEMNMCECSGQPRRCSMWSDPNDDCDLRKIESRMRELGIEVKE